MSPKIYLCYGVLYLLTGGRKDMRSSQSEGKQEGLWACCLPSAPPFSLPGAWGN